MEEKLSGIVLGSINFGENDKILKIFTLEKGVISAKIKGVKKAGAKLKFAAEPFSFVEFIFSVRGDFYSVIGASLIDSFYSVREDIIKFFCAGAVIEFVKKFYKENVDSSTAFVITLNALKKIAYENEPLISLVESLVLFIKDSGYALTLGGCEVCGKEITARTFFDYRRGGFFCEECFDGIGREINSSTLSALNDVMNNKQPPSENVVKGLKLLQYYIKERAEESLTSLDELIKIL
jgi:DNA repair protein RecO (recombination protein O)